MPEITPFINLCSYVSMFSLAMMLLMRNIISSIMARENIET